jgi:serine/threonine protein kinase
LILPKRVIHGTLFLFFLLLLARKKPKIQVDMYSLGNIFYMLLMQNYPFRDADWEDAAEWIQHGQRPYVFPQVWNSTHPVDQVLRHAMVWCHAQDPERRPTARQLEWYLQHELERLDPGRLASWGVVKVHSSSMATAPVLPMNSIYQKEAAPLWPRDFSLDHNEEDDNDNDDSSDDDSSDNND